MKVLLNKPLGSSSEALYPTIHRFRLSSGNALYLLNYRFRLGASRVSYLLYKTRNSLSRFAEDREKCFGFYFGDKVGDDMELYLIWVFDVFT